MNTDLLWLLLLPALGLGGLLLWQLRRRRRRPAAHAQPSHAVQAAHTAQAGAAVAPQAAPSAIETQRLAATEALRQARLRKAAQAAHPLRQQAELQAAPTPPTAPIAVGRALPSQAMAAARTPTIAPAAPVAPLAPVAPTTPPVERSRATAARAARPSTPPTVLLVDDSKLVRVKTGRLLHSQGWQVLLAEDGLAAWRQLEATAIDLLITDVEMPGLDGFELTRRLRDNPRWRDLPVIMISGSDDKHQAAAHAAGVDLLLGKPYAEADLLAQAQRLIGRCEAPAEASLALH